MKYKLKNVYGDPSADGHGKSETINYNCNFSRQKINEIWEKAQIKFGISFDDGYRINFTEEKPLIAVCSDYEDSKLSYEAYKRLFDEGVDFFQGQEHLNVTEEEYENMESYLDSYGIFELQMQMIKVLEPSLKCEIVDSEYMTTALDGGYGCFIN